MPANVPLFINPDQASGKRSEALNWQSISTCYQCEKCTNGCPLVFEMDIPPHRLMRLINLGQMESVLSSNSIWVCASCETCSTRCPNEIDIAHVMDILRQISTDKGAGKAQKSARIFHNEFLGSIKQYGRIYELKLVTAYTLKSEGISGLLKQSLLGLNMMLKGKLKLLPQPFHGKQQVKAIFKDTGNG